MTQFAYKLPTFTEPLPGNLSLEQFLQTVFVGLTGLEGKLVRPKWQVDPPKNPDLPVDWMAFGIDAAVPDANSYVGVDEDDNTVTERHETLDIGVSLYGPKALENYELIRDGFQIQTNLFGLNAANMGFVEVGPARHLPDLVNERFINRIVSNVLIRREIQRIYPILTLVSASGRIHTVTGNEEYLLAWETPT